MSLAWDNREQKGEKSLLKLTDAFIPLKSKRLSAWFVHLQEACVQCFPRVSGLRSGWRQILELMIHKRELELLPIVSYYSLKRQAELAEVRECGGQGGRSLERGEEA